MKKCFCLIISTLLLLCISSCEKPFHKRHIYETIPDAVTDVDGNHYDAVRIGDQVWMKQNLRTTRYADGTEIPQSTFASSYTPLAEKKPYRWAPNNMDINVQKFGWLYNWRAVMRDSIGSDLNPSGVQGICPDGWHVPSDAEWTQLTDYVGSDRKMRCWPSADFSIAKSLSAQTDWNPAFDKCDVGNDLSRNNATGFSALPAGNADFTNQFVNMLDWAYFWTSSYGSNAGAYVRMIQTDYEGVNNITKHISSGLSVRCVKD